MEDDIRPRILKHASNRTLIHEVVLRFARNEDIARAALLKLGDNATAQEARSSSYHDASSREIEGHRAFPFHIHETHRPGLPRCGLLGSISVYVRCQAERAAAP
jgi:hypothetical protein